MKSFRKIVLNLPEYLLIAAVIFYWLSAGLVINYIAISLLTAIILQLIFKNKIIGIIIPTLLLMVCMYMILALLSEVGEFPSFNSDAKTMLFVGLAYFLTTILLSLIMIYKYAVLPTKQ
jgi:hypothetical protein